MSFFFSGSCRGFRSTFFPSRAWEQKQLGSEGSWASGERCRRLWGAAGEKVTPWMSFECQSQIGTIWNHQSRPPKPSKSSKTTASRFKDIQSVCFILQPIWQNLTDDPILLCLATGPCGMCLCALALRDLNLRLILVDEVSKRWWKSGVVHLPGLRMFMVFSCGSWTHPPTKKYYILVTYNL